MDVDTLILFLSYFKAEIGRKAHFNGGHFEIQYDAGYHGNLGGYLALNDSTMGQSTTVLIFTLLSKK